MNPETTYAIVDLEATGTGLNSGECIIQFACILYRDGEIIEEFDTLVQPEKNISKYITDLTGISNEDVKGAPYFEELVELIITLLERTVFVAHNVGFDFRFLNEHIVKAGYPPLTNKTLDTVELSQILWPSADSYKLDELADLIDEPLIDAHNALEDARVTVKLLEALWDRACSLPKVTVKELVRLSDCMAFDTGDFFRDVFEYGNLNNNNFTVVSGVAFKPYKFPIKARYKQKKYPQTDAEKESIFVPFLEKRPNQWQMMDLIFQSFSNGFEKNIAIEAPAGIGKTLGYLFPLTYFIEEDQPLLISTQTTLLQDQIKNTVHSQLVELQGHDYIVSIVKSPNHYLNIAAFVSWVNEIDAKDSSAFSCMRILVWLTDTVTGDLQEIGRGSQRELGLWDAISGYSAGEPDISWREVDFLARRQWKIKHADILITNHTYLSHDWTKDQPVLPIDTMTVFDEAHHLPDVVSQQTLIQLNKNKIFVLIDQLSELMEEYSVIERMSYTQKNQIYYYLDWLEEALQIYFYEWEKELITRKRYEENWVTIGFNPENQGIQEKRMYKDIINISQELLHLLNTIAERPFEEKTKYKIHQQYIQIQLHKSINELNNFLENFMQIFNHRLSENYSHWIKFEKHNIGTTLTFNMSQLDDNHPLINRFINHQQLIFTSSSLSYGNSVKYLENGLGNISLELFHIPSQYNYKENALVLMPSEPLIPNSNQLGQYSLMIAQQLETILKNTELKVLVIFHSLELLDAVSEKLFERKNLSHYQILVQGKSGSRTRILRRFKNSNPSILLGSNSFSEGLDLPGDQLDVVVLPRLPFDSPEMPIFEIYEQTLSEPKHLFSEIMLPRAVIRFKQIFGRLIRSHTDHGILVVLDSRYQTANYKKLFHESLPGETPEKIKNLDEINEHLKGYF